LILPAICAALLLGLACSDDDSDDAGNGDSASERDQFIQDAEEKLADLRAELDDVRNDLASGEASDEVEEQADNLEDRIHDAEAELNDIRASSDDEWEALKAKFNDAVGEADALIEDLGDDIGVN
jgi:predicted  nucleic acid-binding Zn-ribbon protein